MFISEIDYIGYISPISWGKYHKNKKFLITSLISSTTCCHANDYDSVDTNNRYTLLKKIKEKKTNKLNGAQY